MWGSQNLARTICSILARTDWSRSRWCSSRFGVAARSTSVSNSAGASSTSVPRCSAFRRGTVLVEFTVHTGEEILRDGEWTGDWTAAEAVGGKVGYVRTD